MDTQKTCIASLTHEQNSIYIASISTTIQVQSDMKHVPPERAKCFFEMKFNPEVKG